MFSEYNKHDSTILQAFYIVVFDHQQQVITNLFHKK